MKAIQSQTRGKMRLVTESEETAFSAEVVIGIAAWVLGKRAAYAVYDFFTSGKPEADKATVKAVQKDNPGAEHVREHLNMSQAHLDRLDKNGVILTACLRHHIRSMTPEQFKDAVQTKPLMTSVEQITSLSGKLLKSFLFDRNIRDGVEREASKNPVGFSRFLLSTKADSADISHMIIDPKTMKGLPKDLQGHFSNMPIILFPQGMIKGGTTSACVQDINDTQFMFIGTNLSSREKLLDSLKSLASTISHEAAHVDQYRTGRLAPAFKSYDDDSKTREGYANNDLEVEAFVVDLRRVARAAIRQRYLNQTFLNAIRNGTLADDVFNGKIPYIEGQPAATNTLSVLAKLKLKNMNKVRPVLNALGEELKQKLEKREENTRKRLKAEDDAWQAKQLEKAKKQYPSLVQTAPSEAAKVSAQARVKNPPTKVKKEVASVEKKRRILKENVMIARRGKRSVSDIVRLYGDEAKQLGITQATVKRWISEAAPKVKKTKKAA